MAGLAAAHRLLELRPDLQVTVLEGTSEVGGKLRLGEIGGVQVDLGAESMLARRTEGTELAAAVGLADDLVHPVVSSAGVWTRGAIHALPPTLMGVPADLAVAARSGILSRGATLRAQLESRMRRVDLSRDVSIGALVTRRLGRDITDRLVDPLIGGVYAGRCDELSLFAAWPQVTEALRRHGSLLPAAAASLQEIRSAGGATEGARRPPVFAGVEGGLGRLAVATGAEVQRLGGVVRCGAMVRDLATMARGWRLVVGSAHDPEVVEADAVVVATPATTAARLLRDTAPVAARELGGIAYASLAIITVAVAAEHVDVDLSGSGFLVPPVDGTTIKAATYTSLKWGWLPEDLVVLRCSVGRHGDEQTLQRDDTELVAAAMLDLRDATGLRAPLVDAIVTRWGGALPQYAVGHLDRVAGISDAVAAVDGLEVCGAAFDGVGVPAVIATGQAAATRVVEHLDRVATMGP
ncbi:MAG: protoporphyrinogen oxidase [Actinomycetota bacterium]|nr:protoporphyrinogen oxidase [Actinomycetota bacterium]